MSVSVKGAEDFVTLSKNLKQADPNLRKALLRKIREAGKPVAQDMKAGLLAQMPNRNGLNSEAARSPIGIRTRTAGRQAGIRLQASGSKRGLVAATLRSLDESGTWRHPVFADAAIARREWTWRDQTVTAVKGWFTETAEDAKPDIQAKVLDAMAETAAQIVKGV